jgi:hypothetical protein
MHSSFDSLLPAMATFDHHTLVGSMYSQGCQVAERKVMYSAKSYCEIRITGDTLENFDVSYTNHVSVLQVWPKR